MSLFVVDALTRNGRVFDWSTAGWSSPGALPEGCGLFEASDVAQFEKDHPGAIDVTALPVRPPLDVMWIESRFYFMRDQYLAAKEYIDGPEEEWLTYDKFGAFVRCEQATNGGWWVTVDGYGMCSALPSNVAKGNDAARTISGGGVVHLMPFVGSYEIDERGMLVQPEPGVTSVAIESRVVVDKEATTAVEQAEATIAEANRMAEQAGGWGLQDADGESLTTELRQAAKEVDVLRDRAAAGRAELRKVLKGWRPTFEATVSAVIRSVAAMNVRNTVWEPMRASRQVHRDRQRRGLVDPSEVTVLKVPGAQRRAAEVAGSGLPAGERPHHPVLGHFAYYGDSHPDGVPRGLLFGRQEGVFWHPPHWRGSAEAGERRHTYRVVPPETP